MDTTYETPQPAPGRSTFLTVLCILTFIWSSYGIVGGIYGYARADTKAAENRAKMEEVQERMEGKEQPAFVKAAMSSAKMTADDLRKTQLVGILSSILTLTGAALMFTLRKNGYYVYIAGTVTSIIGPLLLFGTGFLGIIGTVAATLVGALFIILYGVNTKDMVR